MKKPVIVSVIIAVMLLAWGFFAPAHAQDTAKEEKPTFYRLIPGVYVNGWPRFTVTYPKDWVVCLTTPGDIFRVSTPGPTPGAEFVAAPAWSWATPVPLDKAIDTIVPFFKSGAKDLTVVSDKPSRLRDGTPAREVEIQMIMNGAPYNSLTLATKRGEVWITISVALYNGKVGEDLKAILYSLQFEPGKDEPVKVPPDVQGFLDKLCSDYVSHDLAKVMTHFSDRFLNSGVRKGEIERSLRQRIGIITSFEVVITELVPAGDKVYLTGFINVNGGKVPLLVGSIIKENGEWKYYGNQRDVSP